MANLTYRLVKGSPLTNDELDGNFQYFTGSHAITGSLTISGSIILSGPLTTTGSLTITGSLTVTEGITGSILGTSSYAQTALTSSYAQTAITASYVSSLLTIAPSDPLPSSVNGAIAFSSSGDFYFGSGSAWNKLTL
jgi:hypothetical protein